MPKPYKTFIIPTGQDEANIPFIFEQFIDSGLKTGSVIAHFASMADADAAAATGAFPYGSMAWVNAVLCRSTGTRFEPVLSPYMSTYAYFNSVSGRDDFFLNDAEGGTPAIGQLAVVGPANEINLTVYDGTKWLSATDYMYRQGRLLGDHTGNTVNIGDPNNPKGTPYNPGGFRDAEGWAINLAGNTFVDGAMNVHDPLGAYDEFHTHGPVNFRDGAITVHGSTSFDVHTWTNFWRNVSLKGDVYIEANKMYSWDSFIGNIYPNGGENGYIHSRGNHKIWNTLIVNQAAYITGGIVMNVGSNLSGGDNVDANSITGNVLWSRGSVLGTAFITTSDSRLKSDIRSAPVGALDIVEAVPTKSYSMDGAKTTFGWQAERVQEVLPTAVVETDTTAYAPPPIDSSQVPEGFSVPEPPDGPNFTDLKSINLSEMTATLWKAVQELSAEVRDLKTQLAGLTGPPA
jgi:hypothetical protein